MKHTIPKNYEIIEVFIPICRDIKKGLVAACNTKDRSLKLI